MNELPFQKIAAFYNKRVADFGYDTLACDYGRRESQTRKFNVLADALNYTGCSVLDVGCGFADYSEHLNQRYQGVEYHGIDISPAMIEKAQSVHPELDLRVANVLEVGEGEQYDVVTANGIFYLLGDNAAELMRQLIRTMFARCRKCVAFNSLSSWASIHEPGEYYADPLATAAYCRELSENMVLRHDYLPHDFTIYLFR